MTHVAFAIPPVDAKAVDATRAAGIRRTARNGAIAGTFLIKKTTYIFNPVPADVLLSL